MEKYGVLHEMRCECGYCVILPDRGESPVLVKEAGISGRGHKHNLKEVPDGGTEGCNIRPIEHTRKK